ncbi:helix-turn-helix domain-containing protein [Streptomyces antimycoticus]
MAGDIVKCIGRQVKLFRERAGLTQAQLGEAIGYSEEQVSSVEQGRRVPQPDFLDAADEALEAFGVLRAAREELLSRQPAPIMSFVTEEAVLRRPYGGAAVLRGQLERLLHVGQMRNVELQVMPTNVDDHAGTAGPLALLEPKGRQTMAYVEAQSISRLLTDRKSVREIEQRYGIIRAQALRPRESLELIEKLRGEI